MKKSINGISYRTKLIWFFLLVIMITTLVGLYNYFSSRVLMKDMTRLINRSQELTTIYDELEQIQKELEVYLSTRSSDSLELFYDRSNSINRYNTILKKSAEYTERGIKIKNVTGMVDHYLGILDETVVAKRNKKIDEYTEGNQKAMKEYEYIGNYIQEIMSDDLRESGEKYAQIQKDMENTSRINYFLFGITVVLLTVIIVLFSYQITQPIIKLASYANEVSKGNFEVEIGEEKTSSEIRILYETFHMMTKSIGDYVNQLKEKQRLERTLTETKVNNLKMKNALHEAELLALQSQVNPHFIFNTINIGSKVAMLQGDDVTCDYLENFAELFRYNLKGLDYHATLEEEVDNVSAYMSLLKTRFGDRIEFILAFPEEEEVRNAELPRMTIQPLIENAYIHGISKFDNGGTIELVIKREEDSIGVRISNTGEGIPEDKIHLILSGKLKRIEENQKKGHTTGIGIDNVLKRLRLFYGRRDVMKISSEDGKTNFILKLPIIK